MLFRNVTIESVGYELPPHRVTTACLEDQIAETMARLNIRPGLLEALTGIRERRFWDSGTMPSEAATRAAHKAIELAGIDPQEIGCLINTSVSKDYIEPSVACMIHGNLKLSPRCINYDIGNACLGFLNGMCSIALMIEAGLIKYGLVVNGEQAREIVEATIKRLQATDVSKQTFMDNLATLTLGSGAVAMVLAHREFSRTGHRLNGAVTLAATQYNKLCVAQPNYMKTDPSKLLVAGLKLFQETWQLAGETFEGWRDEDLALYAPHQVSSRNTFAVAETVGLTPSKVQLTFPTHGNNGPVGLPLSLAIADEAGRIKPGDHVGLLGIGSGLNCSIMSVTW